MEKNVIQASVSQILNSAEGNKRVGDFFGNDVEKAQKFKTSLLNITSNSSLAQCTPQSIIKSAFSLAEVGLDINPILKQAYVLRYSTDAEPVISYKGWQCLLESVGKRSRAFCVFSCDEFSIDYESFEGKVIFKPNFKERDETNKKWFSENLLGVLVRIKWDENEEFYFVSAKKIDKIKGCSPSIKSGKRSPYDEWFEEMYLAKAIKYVLSKQPLSEHQVKLAKALEIENEVEAKIQQKENVSDEFEAMLKETDGDVIDIESTPQV